MGAEPLAFFYLLTKDIADAFQFSPPAYSLYIRYCSY